MRTLFLFAIITGALSAQQKSDFFQRYERIRKQNLMPTRIVRIDTPPPTNARCSAGLTDIPARSPDTAIVRPVPQSPHMPQAQLPAPPCSNQ